MFRRLLPLLALLSLLAACAAPVGPAGSGLSVSAARGVPAVPPEIEREVGSPYASPALQAYVESVGQKLVKGAALPGTYHFVVLDLPQSNAHAVSNYVFVTRGLLATLDDEAELAAALGHELGHLVQRHGAQRARARQGVVDAAVEAATVSGSVTVGRSVARDGLLALRRYSREQELEADRIGLGYLVAAGYRGDAMAGLIENLRRQSQLELRLMGEAPDSADRRSTASTHPAPVERLIALRDLLDASRPGASNGTAFLAAVDGMSVDDPPQEGFVRDNRFLHPLMRLAFTAPPDFRLFNEPDGVLGVGRDRSLLFFSCVADAPAGPLATWMRDRIKPTPVDIQPTVIDGAEAVIGARPRGADTGTGQLRYVMVRHGDQVCYFNLLADGPDRDRRIATLVEAARSFRTLSNAEAAALRPYRIAVVSPAGATPEQLAARLPYGDDRMARLLVLNGTGNPQDLPLRPKIKLVVP